MLLKPNLVLLNKQEHFCIYFGHIIDINYAQRYTVVVELFFLYTENATSQLQLEPNWANILELCDSIRQKDVS